jgi:hypothetical protein
MSVRTTQLGGDADRLATLAETLRGMAAMQQ